jgi:hypothetical protein
MNAWPAGHKRGVKRYNEIMRLTDDPLECGEWEDWYSLTPQERWRETLRLWDYYLHIGGSLDPEPDSQSPFDFGEPPGSIPADGRAGVRAIRRSGI